MHLVIAGFSDLGESLAFHAALIAHFPNYVRNQTLRTRITIVDKELSALPLIQAVQIYQELNIQAATDGLTPTSQKDGEASATAAKAERPSVTEEQLLADATVYADGDKNLLALIKDCKGATRGAVGGPIFRNDCVKGNTTDIWRFSFRGGETAYVVVSGDGDTDLDLYIYDENGNLITYDSDYTDQCVCSFTPRWTGKFTIKIKNRGSIVNCYSLATN